MAAPIKLSELAVGASAVIREFPKADPASIRLHEMGLLVGTRVTLVRTAPSAIRSKSNCVATTSASASQTQITCS